MRARCIVIAFLVLLALAHEANGEPAPIVGETKVQTTETRWLCVPPPSGIQPERCLTVPPGRFIDEDTWARIDAKAKRLQDAETRLTAENKEFRKQQSSWQPGWRVMVGVAVTSFVSGLYVYNQLVR